jgi:hypothetical protein
MKQIKPLLIAFTLLFGVLFFSCSKDQLVSNKGMAEVEFRLMDGPCDYDHLFIDVQGVEIHTDSAGWQNLTPFNAGVYDVLELTNGLDTLLCKVMLPEGRVSQLRLLLGDNNSLETNGSTYDLKVPSGSQSGLKLNLHQNLLANTSYSIWLDFDACKSIVLKGNGDYSLKPVIRVFSDSTNGKLMGYVNPDSLQSVVNVIENSDTITAIPESNGYFMVCGLDGTYDVFVEANDTSFNDTLIQNINVDFGKVVSMDTIFLN